MRAIAIPTVLAAVLTACAATGDDGTGDDVPPGVVDVRVPIPAPDPSFVDLVTPEQVIAAGEEKMFCYYLDNHAGELAVNTLEALQGQYGHHIVLLTTVEPKADGTWEDCSDQSEMWKFRSFVLPVPLPDGYAIKVPDGMQYVMQIHYVNTGEAPILVRDVARLRRVDVTAVQTWVATFTTNRLDIAIPPGPMTASFDCTIDNDLDLLLVGGHMHENGTRFSIDIGPSASALDRQLYLVDPWQASFRNTPPVSLFFSAPEHLTAGTVVRTTCEWMNATSSDITFPAEMCTAFGYLAGTDQPFHCQGGQ
jgi:hypothetical protein